MHKLLLTSVLFCSRWYLFIFFSGEIVLLENLAERSNSFYMQCSACGICTPLKTSNNRTKRGKSADVNRRMVYGMSEMRCGPANLNTLCDVMNMSSISDDSYYDHLNEIADASSGLRATHFDEVSSRYRDRCVKTHPNKQVTPDTILDATVSFDGTWAKTGYSSLVGVVFLILVFTWGSYRCRVFV